MHEQVEPSVERLADLTEDARDVLVRADIARRHERAFDLRRELADVLVDPLSLVREREPRTSICEPPRDRPRDRALVRDPENEPRLALEIHVRTLWIFG